MILSKRTQKLRVCVAGGGGEGGLYILHGHIQQLLRQICFTRHNERFVTGDFYELGLIFVPHAKTIA